MSTIVPEPGTEVAVITQQDQMTDDANPGEQKIYYDKDGNELYYDPDSIEYVLVKDRALTALEISWIKEQRMPRKTWGPHPLAMNKLPANGPIEYFVKCYSAKDRVSVYPIITATTTYSDIRTTIARVLKCDNQEVVFDGVSDTPSADSETPSVNLSSFVGLESFAVVKFHLAPSGGESLTDDCEAEQVSPDFYDKTVYSIKISKHNPYINKAREMFRDLKTLAPDLCLPYDIEVIRDSEHPIHLDTPRITGFDALLARFHTQYPVQLVRPVDCQKIPAHLNDLGFEVSPDPGVGPNAYKVHNKLTAGEHILYMDKEYQGEMHLSLITDYHPQHVFISTPRADTRTFTEFTDMNGGRYFVDSLLAAGEFRALYEIASLPKCDGTDSVDEGVVYPFFAGENIVTAIIDYMHYCASFKAVKDNWYEADESAKDPAVTLIPHYISFPHNNATEEYAFWVMRDVLDF